jgi:hypothetical protein
VALFSTLQNLYLFEYVGTLLFFEKVAELFLEKHVAFDMRSIVIFGYRSNAVVSQMNEPVVDFFGVVVGS